MGGYSEHLIMKLLRHNETKRVLVVGKKYRYTVFPVERTFTGILEWNEDEEEFVIQTYGEDKKYWEDDGSSTWVSLYWCDSIEEVKE